MRHAAVQVGEGIIANFGPFMTAITHQSIHQITKSNNFSS